MPKAVGGLPEKIEYFLHSQAYMNFAKFGFPYQDKLLMSFVGGSHLYGTATEKSDEDWYGVFIPPAEKMLGLDSYEHFVLAGNDKHPDTTLHSLTKFASLAAKGNPTVLGFLFATPKFAHPAWNEVIRNRALFVTKQAARAYGGFADAQMERLLGLRGQKNVNRAELSDKYGYDTKYAMHVVRLYLECEEFLKDGKLTFPSPHSGLLKEILAGKFDIFEFKGLMLETREKAAQAEKESKLPERPDRGEISKFLTRIQLGFWRGEYPCHENQYP